MIAEPKKIFAGAGAGFFLSLTLLFIGPSYYYFANILEIPYFYTSVVRFLAVYSLGAGVAIAALLLLAGERIHQRAVVLVFALGLLFWIQGNLLVWDYGVLDGREITWSDYIWRGLIDSTIWIVVLALGLLKAPLIYRHVAWASLALIVIQGGGLAAEILRTPAEPEWKHYSIGYSDKMMFQFSREKNIIILVLDMFQSDVFQEIIEEEEEYRDIFDGFTYYRNAVGGFPTTYPSVTLILTGRYYDNAVPIQDFIREAFLANSLPLALKEQGYQVDLFEHLTPQAIYTSDTIASNAGLRAEQGQVEKRVDAQKAAGGLLRLTLFRYLPHILKSRVYFIPYRENGQVDQDVAFYNALVANSFFTGDDNVFKFYHLKGTHIPYRLNSRLERERLPQDRSGCLEQAKAVLKIAGELIRQLKENGVYDDSLIFILGDHGDPWAGVGLNAALLSEQAAAEQSDLVDKKVICSGIPVLLMKPFNTSGDLRISDAPVSIGDIPRTIASELKLGRQFPGRSIPAVAESESRERKYYYYTWDSRWDHSYLPEIEEFTVNGHSWLPASWTSTGLIYEPGKGVSH